MKMNYKKYAVRQVEKSDCGPACLSMIAKFYGKRISVERIKQWVKADQNGANGRGMLNACSKMFLLAKGFHLNNTEDFIEMCNSNIVPFIALMNLSDNRRHYVVVFALEKGRVVIGDPALGIQYKKLDIFLNNFSGIALGIRPTDQFYTLKNDDDLFLFKLILKRNALYLLFVSVLSLGIAFFGIFNSLYFTYLMDNLHVLSYSNDLLYITLVVILLIVIKHILDYVRQSLVLKLSKRVDVPLMEQLFKQIIDMPYSFYTRRLTGDIIARFDDVDLIREAITTVFVSLFLDLSMFFCGFYFLYEINSILLLITIIPLSGHLLLSYYFKKRTGNLNMELLSSGGKYKEKLNESINGFEKIKGFNLQEEFTQKLKTVFRKMINNSIALGNMINGQLTLLQCINQVFSIIILYIGASFVLNGQMTLGELITFNSLLYYYTSPLTHVISIVPNIRLAKAANKRITDLVNCDKEDINLGVQASYSQSDVIIKINHIYYSYNYNNFVLKDITMSINRNSVVAIVGASGSGKTTLINLLLGFDYPTMGTIHFGGINIRKIAKQSLRKSIICVNQFNFFFKDTIRNNLLLGCSNSKDNEIRMVEICKTIGIYDFILTLPKKFDFILSENAGNLSGGQRQKLAIVQAILANPKVLIFDESTSNLDAMSEATIKKIIEKLKNITIIIVTHRLSLVKKCDVINVLENGYIVESGKHDELIRQKKVYYHYWKEQMYSE